MKHFSMRENSEKYHKSFATQFTLRGKVFNKKKKKKREIKAKIDTQIKFTNMLPTHGCQYLTPQSNAIHLTLSGNWSRRKKGIHQVMLLSC
ncbi:CLUMA_CG008066, isoform A [Clunio marinus]|uniref:CLUMA_CG008066, isoform A n=1 Tax=Clunio marinus TaxID=568069 RepID=A0A1J1I2Q6_9DIPT|nr:CLUMA_CG008066, isoform A [Clunio marinus]